LFQKVYRDDFGHCFNKAFDYSMLVLVVDLIVNENEFQQKSFLLLDVLHELVYCRHDVTA